MCTEGKRYMDICDINISVCGVEGNKKKNSVNTRWYWDLWFSDVTDAFCILYQYSLPFWSLRKSNSQHQCEFHSGIITSPSPLQSSRSWMALLWHFFPLTWHIQNVFEDVPGTQLQTRTGMPYSHLSGFVALKSLELRVNAPKPATSALWRWYAA